MAASDLEVRIRITADGKAAIIGLDDVNESVGQLGEGAGNADQSLQNMTNTLLSLNIVQGLLGGLQDQLSNIGQTADQWNQLQARLKLVTDSTAEYESALKNVLEISQQTSSDVQATGELYTKLSRALSAAGEESTGVAEITRTVAQAMRISGASAQESEAAITQFAQGLSSGVLRGDEFNSIMEQSPRLAQILTDSLGVTTGELRGMAEQGRLTSDTVIGALKDQAGAVDAEFKKIPDTIGAATQRVSNAFTAMIGGMDDASGASEIVASAISSVAENLDTLAEIASGAGIAALAAGAVQAGNSMRALGASMLAAREAGAAQAAAARAMAMAQTEAAQATALRTRLTLQQAQAAAASAQAALVNAQREVAAAQATLQNMRQLAIFGEQRAAAERQLASAITARDAAERRSVAASQAVAGSQRAAAAAAQANAAAQAQAAAASSLWAGAAGGLGNALKLLSNPMNALMAGMTAMMGYEFGSYLRGLTIEFLSTAENGTLAARAFDLIATSAERAALAQREGAEIAGRNAEKIKTLAEQTGLALASTEDFNQAVERGALVFNEATQAWEKGALSLEAARQSVSKLDAEFVQQAQDLKSAGEMIAAYNKLQVESADLVVKQAAMLGDERAALEAVSSARQVALGARQSDLALAQSELEVAKNRLAALEQEAKAQGTLKAGLAEKIQAQAEDIAKKQQAVEAGQLAVSASELEARAAREAAAAYGDQSAELTGLVGKQAELQGQLATLKASADDAAAASAQLFAAQKAERQAAEEYTTALIRQSDNTDELRRAALAAQEAVAGLEARIEAGASAAEKAAEVEAELAATKRRVVDASKDEQDAIDLTIGARRRDNELMDAAAGVQIAELQRRKDLAAARGNETEAARLGEQIRQTEIQGLQRQIELHMAEAELLRKKAEAKRAEAEATGEFTAAEQDAVAAMEAAATKAELEAAKLGVAAEAKRDAAEASEELADAESSAVAQTESLGNAASRSSPAAQALANSMGLLGSYSQTAAAKLSAIVSGSQDAARGMDNLRAAAAQLNAAAGNDMLLFADAVGQVAQASSRAMRETARQMEGLSALQSALGGASSGMGNLGDEADRLEKIFKGNIPTAEQLRDRFDYLDEAQLSGVIAQVERLRQESENAKRSMDDLTRSLRDQIDQSRGNLGDVEKRRYEEQLKQIKELESASGQSNAEARRLARELHDQKMREIREEAEERTRRDAERQAKDRAREATDKQPGGGEASAPAREGTTQPVKTVVININGKRVEVVAGQEGDLLKLLEELAGRG